MENLPDQNELEWFPGLDEDSLSISFGEFLPHWACPHAVYHVVFRLADSVPRLKREQWLEERSAIIRHADIQKRSPTLEEQRQLQFLYSERIDEYLDAGHGACHLQDPEIADIVSKSLIHFDGIRYRLHAWCIMPNHAHVILELSTGYTLSKIVHSWKSYTATACNKRLQRSGNFWQKDSFNHIIRSDREYEYQKQYVWKNPEKAGFLNWKWRWKREWKGWGG
jgi:REP element-mobilizing transposase RayT